MLSLRWGALRKAGAVPSNRSKAKDTKEGANKSERFSSYLADLSLERALGIAICSALSTDTHTCRNTITHAPMERMLMHKSRDILASKQLFSRPFMVTI